MTNSEFSSEFDILLSNNSFLLGLGLDSSLIEYKFTEYEKSVYLTLALEQIALGAYTGAVPGGSFEQTELSRRYLSNLVRTYECSPSKEQSIVLSTKSTVFDLPSDVWFITYEAATINDDSLKCLNGSTIEVTPVTLDDFHKTMLNPFKGPGKRRAIRLDLDENRVEIVSGYNISKYIIRYVCRPNPIILEDLGDGLTINKESNYNECELNPALHRSILELAVKLALQSKSAGKNV